MKEKEEPKDKIISVIDLNVSLLEKVKKEEEDKFHEIKEESFNKREAMNSKIEDLKELRIKLMAGTMKVTDDSVLKASGLSID